MKIAQITECLTDNGVATVVRNLSTGFRDAGHQVEIITWKPSTITDPGLLQVRVTELSDAAPSIRSRLFKMLCGVRLLQYFNSGYYSRELLEQIEFDSYDAVLIHGLACIPFWRLPSSAIIVAHSTKSRMLLRARQFLLKPVLRLLYSRMYNAHPVICVSQGSRDDMIKNFKINTERVVAIYNPFPVEQIRCKSMESIDDVPGEYLLAVGRPVKSKRFDRLMRVYKRSGICDPLVIMVGSGRAGKVKKLAQRYGVSERVKVIGHRENPYPYMAKAKLLVLTSDYEGLPTVLIESLICGTPVISTDCPSGPQEILAEKYLTGLVGSSDERVFAERLRQLYSHPYVVEKEDFDTFSSRWIIDSYLKFMDSSTSA